MEVMCAVAQVCVSRMQIEMLERHLKGILEGILLWSEDSKNKFKLKVGPFRQILISLNACLLRRTSAIQTDWAKMDLKVGPWNVRPPGCRR